MKTKKYIQGITFFITLEMYREIKLISDTKQMSLSELLREVIEDYLEKKAVNIITRGSQ